MLQTTHPQWTDNPTRKTIDNGYVGYQSFNTTLLSHSHIVCAVPRKSPPGIAFVVMIADDVLVNACRRQTDVIRPVVRPRGRNLITVSNSFNICVLASALSLTTACFMRSSFIFAILSSLVKVFL